jgi:cobalt-zinc-cadmium efflux system outer membrane protein
VLSDPNDADDAFQATFLVLARRASSGSINRPGPLGPWLAGVALRVARKARVAAARRRRHEANIAGRPDAGGPRPDDLAVTVREEVERLPEPLRRPVVLCYLEDMTYQGAARQLRVSEGTIRGRLVKARSLLRSRLGRHDDVSATGRTGQSSRGADPPRIAPALSAATVRAAMALAPGAAGLAGLPAAVAGLMEGALKMSFVTHWIIVALSLPAIGLIAGGGRAPSAKGDDRPSAATAVASRPEPPHVEARQDEPPDPRPDQVLTLDDAIVRLVSASARDRSGYLEIPMARADVLIAGLRDGPVFSADGPPFRMGQHAGTTDRFDTRFAPSQFDTNVTYADRPIPPPQNDINISHPLDYSLKRRLRSMRAGVATTVVEAQYQDAVRIRIAALYSAYVDVQEMQELIRLQNQAAARCRPLLQATGVGKQKGTRSQLDEDVLMSGFLALAGPADGRQGDRARARRRALARLLELPTGEADGLKVEPIAPMKSLPPVAELIRLGLERRPDIAALRLGLIATEAAAEKASKQATRNRDSYLLYQPYLFQDRPSEDREDAKSYALGVTVPLPVYERHGGDVSRAQVNLQLTRIQLASAEKALTQEVEQLHRQCESSLAEVRGLQITLRNEWRACQVVGQKYAAGEAGSVDVRNAWLALRKTEIRQLELMVKYRQGLLALNTAVGVRLFP